MHSIGSKAQARLRYPVLRCLQDEPQEEPRERQSKNGNAHALVTLREIESLGRIADDLHHH